MVTYLGSLVQLCCEEGETLQTNIAGVCGGCSQCMDHTGFAPAPGGVCFLGLHSSAPGCSVGLRLNCPCVLCTSQVYAAQVHLLRHSARAQTRLGLRFVPFPGPSSSGRQLLGEFTVPGVPCVSRGELTSGCEPPDRCQPSRIPGRLG